ncbi:MAG: transglutaminase-like domain-containing protein [Lachnospiraceae bacterium]|nr:transglutaminase-like domain-containing protein [Lachnospiraceae bacterium]
MKIRKVTALILAAGLFFSGCGAQSASQSATEKEKEAVETAENVTEEDVENAIVETNTIVEDTTDIQDEAVALATSSGALSTVLTPVAAGIDVKENDDMIIDYSNIAKGYVMVKYKESTDKKLKAQVKGPSGVTYTYNLKAKNWEAFPLSDGNGSYKVTVYKNVSGTSYVTVGSIDFKVTLDDEMLPFLTASQYVNFDESSKCVKKAATLCKKTTSTKTKVKKVYKWTLGHFSYDYKKAKSVQSGYLPDLDKVYSAKKGICFDYASTMVAMLRSQGVPTKLVIGYAGDAYHAWINVYSKKDGWITGAIYFDGKSWNLMDPTFADTGKSSKAIMKYISNGKNYSAKYIY